MHRERQVRWVARISSRPLGLALVVALLALTTACGTQHSATDEGARATAGATDWLDQGSSEVHVSRVIAAFALLRTPAKGLPTGVRKIMSARIPGMRWNRAHPVPTALSATYWLVPGIEHLCLLEIEPQVSSIGTVCETNGQALSHGIANASLDRVSRSRTIVGVVPDGTRTVTVESGRLRTLIRAPRDGIFVHHDSIPLPPDRLTLH